MKRERAEGKDEQQIIKDDTKLREEVDKLMRDVYMFSKLQIENKEAMSKSKSTLKSRLQDTPFSLDVIANTQQLKFKGKDGGFFEAKKTIS